MGGILEADKIIRSFQTAAPVPVVRIAYALGLKVFLADTWPDDLSAMIRLDDQGGESGYSIYVNQKHSPVRQRFSVAHEIAHFALHRNLIGDGVTDDALYRSKLSSHIEAQANKMAADILMPWSLIQPATDSGINSVEELAKMFNVSKSAMSIRLGVPA